MKQSKLASLVESVSRVLFETVIFFFLQWIVFFIVKGEWLSLTENLLIQVMFTVGAIITGYISRRIFNKIS